MSFRPVLLLLCLVAATVVPATSAAAAERFVGIDVSGKLVSFTSDASTFTSKALTPTDSTVMAGLHLLPDGRLLALDVLGRVYVVDPTAASLTMLYNGGAVASGFGARPTFAVTPDGSYALLATAGKAELLNVATGAVTPFTLPAYAAGDSGAGRTITPYLDFMPGGTLAGVDGTAPAAVVTEAALGGPLSTLGGFPVAISGPTGFTLAPDGSAGWLVTRSETHVSRLVAVNPLTGATDAPGITYADGFDAIAAIGPTATAVTPPTGAPAPTTPVPAGKPVVRVTVPARQSASGIASRRAITLTAESSVAATITVVARLGTRTVARLTHALAAGRALRLSVPTTHGSAAVIRTDRGRTVRLQIVVAAPSGEVSLKRSVLLVR